MRSDKILMACWSERRDLNSGPPVHGIDGIPSRRKRCAGRKPHCFTWLSHRSGESRTLYKATRHRLPPISSMSCSFVILPSHGPTGVVRTVPLKLVGAQPMQLFDGDPVEAVCLSPRTRSTLFGSCCRKALVHHANCRTLPAGMSRWFCQILIGMSWQCGRSDTPFKPHCFIPADVGNQDSALKI